MSKYLTNNQLRVCELTMLKGLTDRQAGRRMRKTSTAVKQARYRLRMRVKKDPAMAAVFS